MKRFVKCVRARRGDRDAGRRRCWFSTALAQDDPRFARCSDSRGPESQSRRSALSASKPHHRPPIRRQRRGLPQSSKVRVCQLRGGCRDGGRCDCGRRRLRSRSKRSGPRRGAIVAAAAIPGLVRMAVADSDAQVAVSSVAIGMPPPSRCRAPRRRDEGPAAVVVHPCGAV